MDTRPDDPGRVIEDFRKELTHAHEFIAAVRTMTMAATQAEDEEGLLASYSRAVTEYLPAQRHLLVLCLTESKVQVSDVAVPETMGDLREMDLEAFGQPVADRLRRKKSYVLEPCEGRGIAPELSSLLHVAEVKNLLCVPVIGRSRATQGLVGAAIVANAHGKARFESYDYRLLQVVSTLAIDAMIRLRELRDLRRKAKALYTFPGIVGQSHPMQEVYRAIRVAADNDCTVLIYGEVGTGKELIARAVHLESRRGKAPSFVAASVLTYVRQISSLPEEIFGGSADLRQRINAEFRAIPGFQSMGPKPSPSGHGIDDPDEQQFVDGEIRRLGFHPKQRDLLWSLVGQIWRQRQSSHMFNFFSYEAGAADSGENMAGELFGVKAEGYTGVKGGPGRFQVASYCGGTLLLNNIHNLPLEVQHAILNATEIEPQRRVVSRRGAAAQETVSARIIAATNQELDELVARGELTAELASRFKVCIIRIPPLRDRGEDIPALVDHFLGMQNEGRPPDRQITGIEEDALKVLKAHDWPENVRELETVIIRAAIDPRTTDTLGAEVVDGAIERRRPAPQERVVMPARTEDPPSTEVADEEGKPSQPSPDDDEPTRLRALINKHRWNVAAAAKEEGCRRETLHRRLIKHGIRRPTKS